MQQTIALTVLWLVIVTSASAESRRHGEQDFIPFPPGAMHYDAKFHHDRYYPSIGYSIQVAPAGAFSVSIGGLGWYFHSGVWYRPVGHRYVVAVPPVGVIVPYLPVGAVTIWVGAASYYYANGVYYAVAPGSGFITVAPPEGSVMTQAPAPTPSVNPVLATPIQLSPQVSNAPPTPSTGELILYPRNGQSVMQTDKDRKECMQWASAQPSSNDPIIFQRALAACIDGRGYTAR